MSNSYSDNDRFPDGLVPLWSGAQKSVRTAPVVAITNLHDRPNHDAGIRPYHLGTRLRMGEDALADLRISRIVLVETLRILSVTGSLERNRDV